MNLRRRPESRAAAAIRAANGGLDLPLQIDVRGLDLQGRHIEPTFQADYHPEEVMLLEPSAIVKAYGYWEEEDEPFQRVGQAAVVTIEGPLLRKGGWCYDGYDSILERWTKAHESDARAVVVRAHSPGGYLSGCFDTVRAMRAVKKASGKKTILIADQAAYSAMYALATAADEIHCPPSAGIGSIGVISYRIDWSKANEEMGVLVVAFASGKQKTDGDPNTPLSDEERARHMERTMLYFGQFAELVAEARPLTVAQIRAQEAGIYVGEQAVRAGLADGTRTFAEVIAELEKTSVPVRGDVGRQARGEKKTMEITAFAVVLGLSADATDQQCADKLAAQAATERKLLDITGEANAKDAFVKVDAWRDGSEKATAALDKLATTEKEVERLTALESAREFEAKFAEGKREGKIVPENEKRVRANYDGDLAGLVKFLAGATVAVPGAQNADKVREAAAKKDAADAAKKNGSPEDGELTWNGKAWRALAPDERAALFREDKDLYHAMKASSEK